MRLSVYLCVCLRLSVGLSVYLSTCLSVGRSAYLSVCVSVFWFSCLSVCLWVCLSLPVSVCLSVCLSIFVSVCFYLSFRLANLRLESFRLTCCVYSCWSFLFSTTHPKRNICFSVFRETTCNLAKTFYCYVFEMTTERIVSFFYVLEYIQMTVVIQLSVLSWWRNFVIDHGNCLFSFQAKVVLYSIGK